MVLAAAVTGSLTATATAVGAAGTLNGKFKDRPSEILPSCNDVVWQHIGMANG